MVYELITRVRDEFKFSHRELKQIFLSAIFFSFIFSFRKWGVSEFNISIGLTNLIFSFIAIIVIIILSLSVQKIWALGTGYIMHYNWWFQGILIGLLITFITVGYVPVIFPGTTHFEFSERLRLGQYRRRRNPKDMGWPSIAGILTNILLGLIFGFIYLSTKNYWIMQFIKLNFLYAFFCMLPIPKFSGVRLEEGATPGIHIFFFGRPFYILLLFTIIVYSILICTSINIFGNIPIFFLSLFIGLIVMYIFIKRFNLS